jgi:PTS system nitrogen regulatory IIA component
MQLSVKEISVLLNVAEKTIYRWIKQGNIPVYRINGQNRFSRTEILEWATSKRIPVSPQLMVEEDSGSAALPTLTETLRAADIHYHVAGTTKTKVLQSVVELMHLPEGVDRDFLYHVLLARETLGSTGVGDGVAIPHVRNPIVLHITEPILSLCFLEQPIPFGAIDGEPVNVLFTLISPTVRVHLHLLSRLGYVLRHPGFKNALKKQELRDGLLQALGNAELLLPAQHPVETSHSHDGN